MNTKIKEINLLNDAMFKSLMTNKNNREMVIDVLHAITGIEKEILEGAAFIGGEELPKRKITEKKKTTDITIKVNNKHQIIIEMNQYNTPTIFEKNTNYAMAKLIENTEINSNKYPQIILINLKQIKQY